jgi:hypothetical protein
MDPKGSTQHTSATTALHEWWVNDTYRMIIYKFQYKRLYNITSKSYIKSATKYLKKPTYLYMYILRFMWVMAGWQYYFNWAYLLLQALCYHLYKFTTTAGNLSYLHYLTFLSVVHAQEQCTLKISYLPKSKRFLFKFSCNIITLLHVNSLCYIISV